MEGQRAKARAAWAGSGDTASENVWFPLREKLGATEFLGYETETAEGVAGALVKDGNEVESLKAGESGAVVLNQTPFYAESGGQVGDTGVLTGEGVRFRVTDTQKKAGGDLFVHLGTVEQGTLKPCTALALEVDHAGRVERDRGHRQRRGAGECRGHHEADGGGRRPRRRCARAVRRKIRRRGARGVDGQDCPRAWRERAGLVGGTVRRHPCPPY